jgi:hypothetical protein
VEARVQLLQPLGKTPQDPEEPEREVLAVLVETQTELIF